MTHEIYSQFRMKQLPGKYFMKFLKGTGDPDVETPITY